VFTILCVYINIILYVCLQYFVYIIVYLAMFIYRFLIYFWLCCWARSAQTLYKQMTENQIN